MKFSTRIFAASLAVNAAGAALYLAALRLIYIPFVSMGAPALLAAGLLVLVFVPTAFFARARALAVDRAAAEKASSGFVGEAGIEAIDLAHYRLSWFPVTFQNAAVFVAFAIGESLFESDPLIVLRLPFWREFAFLMAPFLLAGVGQSLLFNVLFARARERLEVKTLRGPRRFGLAQKIVLSSVSLVLVAIAHVLGIAQIGVSRIYLETGISSTRIAYRDLPGGEAKLSAALAMLDGMDELAAKVTAYDAEARAVLESDAPPEGYLESFFTEVHLKNPLMAAIEGKSDDLVREILLYMAINLPLTALVLGLLSYQILLPFALIRAAERRAGSRALANRLPVSGIDEIGELVDRFNGIIAGNRREFLEISRIVRELEKSDGELAKAVGEVGDSAMGIDTATEASLDAESMQKGFVATAESDVAALAGAVEKVGGAIGAQNAAIEGLSTEISRISEGVEGVRSIAASSERAASRIAKAAEEGTTSARACVKRMSEIEASSRDAADIVRVVGEIADKTKLLAMNASIEAAHAGASGKGFAVIASEIRSLANATGGQTKAVLDGIGSMVLGIADAARLSERADAAFRDVAREAGESSSLARETAATANEQAESTAGIRRASEALVEQARGLGELAQLLGDRTDSLASVAKDLVASSKGIGDATEAQAEAARAASEAVDRLEAVAEANRKVLNALETLAGSARGSGPA